MGGTDGRAMESRYGVARTRAAKEEAGEQWFLTPFSLFLSGKGIRWGMVGILLLGWILNAHAADEIASVEKILSNPSAFHRHDVVLKGELKLVGQWEGKDTLGSQTCGPIFKLEDDTGEIPVMYVIRCDQNELNRLSAMAGGQVIVHATIEAETVSTSTSGNEFRTRAMAKKIRREDR